MLTCRLYGGSHVTSWPLSSMRPDVGCLEAADHPQGRRLAAARRAEEAEELAGLDLEVDVVDRHGLAEALDHVHEPDVDGGHVRSVLLRSAAADGGPGRRAPPASPRSARRHGRMRARIWAPRARCQDDGTVGAGDGSCEIRTITPACAAGFVAAHPLRRCRPVRRDGARHRRHIRPRRAVAISTQRPSDTSPRRDSTAHDRHSPRPPSSTPSAPSRSPSSGATS